jgi:hypothetical protein
VTDKTIDLDQHRGMAAQKATNQRRLVAEVEANDRTLTLRRDELETLLLAAPGGVLARGALKARYVLQLFVGTLAAEDRRRQQLIAVVLADFKRLSGETT